MRHPLPLASALILVALAGCAPKATYDYAHDPDPRGSEYKVGPLDQLSVVVWKNKELSADVTVRPDGLVTLPLIGDLRAGGRTPTDIQKEVTKRLADYVRNEEMVVSVGLLAVNSYTFTVSGNVERTGLYSSKAYVTTVEAVAMAGGPNKFAGDSVYIVRGAPARRIPIALADATSGKHPEQNLVVMRGDVIVVP